jgi:hypothetical protein
VTAERLLGSYLVRVSLSEHARRIAVHSVLTGERRGFADFAELAAFLDATTAEEARQRAESEPTATGASAGGEVAGPVADPGSGDHRR